MPITLNCPKCHKPFRVRDESIGGRVRCPSCGSVLQVPAALSPPSHYGGDMPRPTVLPGSAGGTERPLADEVPPTRFGAGSDDQVMLGGTGKREEEDLGGRNPDLPAPPSIKVKGAPESRPAAPLPPTRGPRPAAPTAAIPKAPAPTARGRATQRLPMGPAGDDLAWKRVRGGLGMIRWGLLLMALVFLGAFAHAAWIILDQDTALDDGPGFLKMPDWPKWKEAVVAYTAVPLVPAVLLLFFGRLRCGRAPAESHARGLARGAALFTFLALVGAAVYVALTFFDVWRKTGLPAHLEHPVRWTGLFVAVPSVLLADVLTLLFIGQIGWPVGRPQLQTAVAGYFAYVLLLPAAILIAHQFYPIPDPLRKGITLSKDWHAGGFDDATIRNSLIWGVILLVAVVLVFLRYAGTAGAARRAIRKYLAGEA